MTKRLYRSRKDRIIGGVCGGIAEYLQTDPTLIRLIWTIITILSFGFGILAYLAFWIIVPEKPMKQSIAERGKQGTQVEIKKIKESVNSKPKSKKKVAKKKNTKKKTTKKKTSKK